MVAKKTLSPSTNQATRSRETLARKNIAVYADWEEGKSPFKLGTLTAYPGGGKETFAFEFEADALAHGDLQAYGLDPLLGLHAGPQYGLPGRPNFGLFMDASPDRWGRLLMKRRLDRDKRKGLAPHEQRLFESDFLLGVHDGYRVGALRFRLEDAGPFLDDSKNQAAPPLVQLRALEQASLALEANPSISDKRLDEWLRLLLAPGGSLGGARPKASVIDPSGRLWIAKFPSYQDNRDVGAWELLVHTLARGCGIRVPSADLKKFSSNHHTFLIDRFDRTATGGRSCFASAMTLTNHEDGEDGSTGVSYLELVKVLISHGADTTADLQELWKRIVFNMFVSNTDDHLRNHGFLLIRGQGWKLSPAYDMNPVPDPSGLKLNVSENDNTQDIGLALSVAPLFRLTPVQAQATVDQIKAVTGQWRALAQRIGIPGSEQDDMAPAFLLADKRTPPSTAA